MTTSTPQPDAAMIDSLINAGLLTPDGPVTFEALTGGVSSDIWKVETPERVFCVKRALSKLKVAADWFAPVERNQFEVTWYAVANALVPGVAPQIFAHDADAMLFAMAYLDPDTHRLWKTALRDGNADPSEAAAVGYRLGKIHGGTANAPDVAAKFPANDIFHAIRLEPYLEATASAHPDLKAALFGLSQRTADTRLVMIHGDVSPKNILLGPAGPVILDAECACMGDPAFDVAFCLNHFLLKCLWTPSATDAFMTCFDALASAYLAEVSWESRDDVEYRIASLLPGLFLARVDGKSPVEYVTETVDKNKVRRCARALIISPPDRLSVVADAWKKELSL